MPHCATKRRARTQIRFWRGMRMGLTGDPLRPASHRRLSYATALTSETYPAVVYFLQSNHFLGAGAPSSQASLYQANGTSRNQPMLDAASVSHTWAESLIRRNGFLDRCSREAVHALDDQLAWLLTQASRLAGPVAPVLQPIRRCGNLKRRTTQEVSGIEFHCQCARSFFDQALE